MGSGTGYQSTETGRLSGPSWTGQQLPRIWQPARQSGKSDYLLALMLEQASMLKRSQRIRRRYDLPDSKMLLAQLVGSKVKKLGFEFLLNNGMEVNPHTGNLMRHIDHVSGRVLTPSGCQIKGQDRWFKSMNGAISYWILQHPRSYGKYKLTRKWNEKQERIEGRWLLLAPETSFTGHRTVAEWVCRPTRQALADVLRHQRKRDSAPSHARPDTQGWRGWVWDTRNSCLKSPAQGTLWDCGPELRVTDWSESDAVRGHAGIHACRLPRGDWRAAHPPSDFMGSDVVGLVERFGRFVLGKEGWRAEWVIIRELLVCDEITASHVRRAYPEIPVGVALKGHWLRKGEY